MKKVVWADDDPLGCQSLRQELESRGSDITFLDSCAEYLELIDSGVPADLFIPDLVMPPAGRVSGIASNHGMETGAVPAFETRKAHAGAARRLH